MIVHRGQRLLPIGTDENASGSVLISALDFLRRESYRFEPVAAEGPGEIQKAPEAHGFGDERGCAGFIALQDIFIFLRGGENDDGGGPEVGIGFYFL